VSTLDVAEWGVVMALSAVPAIVGQLAKAVYPPGR
jgi:hypothetical protein